MNCCSRCFAHPWLRDYIIAHSQQKGDCPFCEARTVPLIPIAQIAHMFDAMMSLYSELNADTMLDLEDPLDVGRLLLNSVQEDWGLFSPRLTKRNRAGHLLLRLANYGWDDDSGEPQFNLIDLYTTRVSWSHETLEQALEGVLHDLDQDPNDPEISTKMGAALEEHLEMLSRQLKRGTVFYRGRPGCAAQGEPYVGTAIGAPPAAHAVPGRANRAGISVLYLARNAMTVAAELRARIPNGPISICRVRPRRDLRLIDVVKGFPGINPFTSSEEHLGWTIEIAELLNLFSSELSRPVQSDDNPEEYRVTQQLCEAVRSAGYDGILYPSTRHERGTNLVVFDPSLCRIARSWLVQ